MNETLDALTTALFDQLIARSMAEGVPARVGERLQTVLGGTPERSREEYWVGGSVGWINSGKVNEFRIIEPSALITVEALASSAAKLLPTRTTVVAITGATLGQVSLTEFETSANQSVVGILGSAELPSEFVYLWFRANIGDLVSRKTGGAQQHVNKGDVNEFEISVPPPHELNRWLEAARPLFDQIKCNCWKRARLPTARPAAPAEAHLRRSPLPQRRNGHAVSAGRVTALGAAIR